MKKKIIILALTATLSVSFLTGCSTENAKSVPESRYENMGMKIASSDKNLVYDKDTKIVYYMVERKSGSDKGYGFMSPYYFENGKLCKFVNGKIMEIKDE